MKTLESVAVNLTTSQGFSLAVGGICLAGTGIYWEERFLRLQSIHVSCSDIYGIDYLLAQAIRNIAEESLLIAGGSLDAGIELAQGESTGGVLGAPGAAICSASDICEALPEGFSLYTAAGGPGLAALADPVTTERAAKTVKGLGNAVSDKAILDCMSAAGIDTFLLVMDGSGPGTHGCLAAGSPGKSKIIFI